MKAPALTTAVAMPSHAPQVTDTTSTAGSSIAQTPYGKKLASVCSAIKKKLNSNPPFPISNFNPIHPDVSKLPTVGRFFEQNSLPDFEAGVASLDKLHPPADQKQKFEQFRKAFDADAASLKRQVDAAKASQAAAFVATVHAVTRVIARAKVAGAALGIPACSNVA